MEYDDIATKEIKKLQAENKKLKEALGKIATHEIDMYQKLIEVLTIPDEEKKEYIDIKSHSCRIAEQALKGESDG